MSPRTNLAFPVSRTNRKHEAYTKERMTIEGSVSQSEAFSEALLFDRCLGILNPSWSSRSLSTSHDPPPKKKNRKGGYSSPASLRFTRKAVPPPFPSSIRTQFQSFYVSIESNVRSSKVGVTRVLSKDVKEDDEPRNLDRRSLFSFSFFVSFVRFIPFLLRPDPEHRSESD